MKALNKIFIAAIAATAMTACNNELGEQFVSNNGGDVKFTMGIEGTSASRVAMEDGSYQASFESTNAVGIFVKEVASYSNLEYTYNGNAWTGTTVNVPADGVYTYYAYYPYAESATSTAIAAEVIADQETGGYLANDYLMADLTADPGQANVDLKFTHALSLVEVTLSGPNAAEDAVVALSNMTTDATINLETSVVTPGTKKANVTMDKLTTSMKYRAIVPEQTVAQGTSLMTIVSKGRTYKVTYNASDVKFEKGKYISLNVELGSSSSAEDVTVTITSQGIDNWGEGTAVTGDATVDEVPLIETIGENLVSFAGTADRNANIGDTWFKLINAAGTTAGATGEIVESGSEEVVWEKAAKLTYTSVWDAAANNNQGKAVNNSYYVAAVGYLHDAAIYTSDTEVYKLTFKAKSNLVKTTVVDGTETPVELSDAAKIVVTCRNAKDNASFALTSSSTSIDGTGTTSTTIIPANKDTWESFTAYIYFGKKHTTVGTPGAEKMLEATAEDLQKIDIRFYTNNPSSADGEKITATIFISDVKLEPYIQ